MTDRIPLTPSDSWFLLSVALASADSDVPLSSVIAVGDAINHAIFTPQEVRRGTAKLLAARLIRYENGRYALTSSGSALLKRTSGPMLNQWHQLNVILHTTSGPSNDPQFEDPHFPFAAVPDASVAAAVRQYLGADRGRTDPGGEHGGV